ncbi:response regulator [Algoriphagus aquimarinus]|uniref:Response regulatory domain-containing protein n=1 Tax=Algoriphagus aquimarinus TaxID=237018 RepID=A0A1I1APM4_9BACT|nr:hypothetical protein [Algoriphagus aquimarinus]SFB39974.1 hypothetical protein SAMN04489723_10924 [Algoriphagus aquimarinus]
MNLLIVEDDKPTIQSYLDNIESFNKNSDVQIEAEVIDNLADAKKSLISPDYDAAIIDLKLSSNSVDLEGLEIVDEIKDKLRFPIFIVSGSLGQVEREENAFFKKRSRDGNFKDILIEITDIYKTGVTNILGRKGTIEKYLNSIFWNHMSNSMGFWIKDTTRTPQEKENSLLRYTLLHMQEHIDEELEKYHPSEFYISKPIKKNLYTGDIIELDKSRFLILTPSCDIVLRPDGNRNADFILFCKIKSLESVVKNYELLKHDTSQKNDNRMRINGFFENKNQKYHFIPKAESIDPGLIDFQEKMTIPSSEVNELLKAGKISRIATISQPFLKDVISRYSTYYSRQGSPDFNIDEIYKSIFIKEDDSQIKSIG